MLPRRVVAVVFALLALCLTVGAQTQTPPPAQQSDDVLRINTELVQTDAMVLDRRGQFVDGLKPGQFVLTLNGQAKNVCLLERVTSGSSLEAAQINSSRSTFTVTAQKYREPSGPADLFLCGRPAKPHLGLNSARRLAAVRLRRPTKSDVLVLYGVAFLWVRMLHASEAPVGSIATLPSSMC